jgi:hypothetical protein
MRAQKSLLVVSLAVVLAGCQPAPRSVSYFDANPSERAGVMARCRTGDHRGTECKNAQASTERATKLKTMNDYRRGF